MYVIRYVSRKVHKSFEEVISRFSDSIVNKVENELKQFPKGKISSHWNIKKVAKDVWQYDLPNGYRIEYTVSDEYKTVIILFIGDHEDAAAYLRSKK